MIVTKGKSFERSPAKSQRALALEGVLVGTAVGDALGLPMEGLCAARQARFFPPPLRHRFVGRVGMISDDTEHTLMVAQALLKHPEDVAAFQRCFAWKLRWWLASLPAGVGFATLRAILKLWLGFPAHRSGIYSAGNGPAMRSALLGVYFSEDPERRRQFVHASTILTHRDPRAEIAALAVAETAAWMTRQGEELSALLHTLAGLSQLSEWSEIVGKMSASLGADESVEGFARSVGVTSGISGYAFQSVPVAIYAALRHAGDFKSALTEAIACGGDTDTVGAICGALVGARVGAAGMPADWVEGVKDWPRSVSLLRRVSERLACKIADGSPGGGPAYCWPAVPLRNLVFLAIVLAHGFRRLLPPY